MHLQSKNRLNPRRMPDWRRASRRPIFLMFVRCDASRGARFRIFRMECPAEFADQRCERSGTERWSRPCDWTILSRAATSRIGAVIPAASVAAVSACRWRRRTWHRHDRRARPRRLGARHRSAPADQRWRNFVRRWRPDPASGGSGRGAAPGAPSDDIGRFVVDRARQYRRGMDRYFPAGRPDLQQARPRAVSKC